MRPVRWSILLLCSIVLTAAAQDQLLDIGTDQNPPGISWQSLETPRFRIIFPQEIGPDAQRAASLLERIYEADCATLGARPKRLPLILHNRTIESNGFVTLAPRRSEWYNTPPQVGLTGPVEWYTLLAIHEFRHVVQFQRLNSGFNRLLYLALGETGWMAGVGISAPTWFFEGDAVVMETALTRGGRGRQPEFLMPIRALLLSGRPRSYFKMTLGSCKNWIGDPYSYGFVLNTWLRRRNGAELWPPVLKSTANLSFIPFRFSWALKRRTGMGAIKSHEAAMVELAERYRANLPPQDTTAVRRWNRDNDGFLTVYQSPGFAGDSAIIALKYGLADQRAFVRIHSNGREETLFRPNTVDGSSHTLAGTTLVWAEEVPDPRWGRQSHQAIKRYDFTTGALQTVVKKGRYFAPAISPDGAIIAAVEHAGDNRCRLVLLDSNSGRELHRFENPGNAFLMTPAWSPDGREIALNRLTAAGRALALLDVEKGVMTDLIPPGAWTMATPVWCGSTILFSSNDGETEQIFAVRRRDGRLFRVTSRPYGAFYPAPSADGQRLLFNDFDLEGYHAAETALDSSRWTALDQLPVMVNSWFEPVAAQEAGPSLLYDHLSQAEAGLPEEPAQNTWPVRPLSSWRDPGRIHSWQFYLDDIRRTMGAEIYSRNLLGTLQASAGYDYDRDEKAGAASAAITWARLYPLIDLGALYGHRASTYSDDAGAEQRYTWKEQSAFAGFRLPLNLSRQGYSTTLTLQSRLQWTLLSGISDDRAFDRWKNSGGWWRSAGYALNFSRFRRSRADIFPVRGQILEIGYDHTPWDGDWRGGRFNLSASLFFPGLSRRHGLALRADYEEQKPDNYRYSSRIRFPRGYGYRYQERIGRLALDYALPLAYPDQHIWALLYIQRLKSLFFHDYGWSESNGRRSFYRASGLELTADTNLLSYPVLFELGVRLAWRWREKDWRSEAVIGLPL
ncbi:MAG TPA: hypothetical protein PLO28_08110 [bacterium]|nr:hypothetical protein [bacterium]